MQGLIIVRRYFVSGMKCYVTGVISSRGLMSKGNMSPCVSVRLVVSLCCIIELAQLVTDDGMWLVVGQVGLRI